MIGLILGSPDPTNGLLEYVRSAGVLGLLVIAVVGSVRKWWAPAWYVKQLERERDEWKTLALSGTRLAERSSSVLEEAIRRGR